MTHDATDLWTDRSWLQVAHYGSDAKLAARQSIYAYRRPRLDLPSRVLGLADLRGDETVTDVGCGNGAYLGELIRRRHTGRMLGVDLSIGMLHAARSRVPEAGLISGDASALPLRDDISALTLAMHMLYHLPEPLAAVRELRRITQPAGRVLVVLNGKDHLREKPGAVMTSETGSWEIAGVPHTTASAHSQGRCAARNGISSAIQSFMARTDRAPFGVPTRSRSRRTVSSRSDWTQSTAS